MPGREALLAVRAMILDEAAALGLSVTESLKWGQPSYAAPGGTPIRLGRGRHGGAAVFTHCATSVVPEFRAAFGDRFRYDGTRGVLLDPGAPPDELRMLIRRALTYRG
ncbi:DUF1801 domain-containing protein [Rhodobacterales bacterium HKCCE2091]|nr:DUF1801 domain-containing protein [Rhodobacterales bacterium HKCCE2091]